jgi:PAS domain S-box-containing protein
MQAMSTAIDDSAYRSLFDQNPHPMWVFDRGSLAFLAVNDAAIRQYGYSRAEFLRMTILDIRPPEDETSVRDSFVPGLSRPQVWTHVRKDGSPLLAEITAHDLTFGEKPARLVLALDVTVREQNAQLARRKEDILRTVLQVAPVGVLVLSSEGAVIEVNEEARRLLGNAVQVEDPAFVERMLEASAKTGGEIELTPDQWVEVRSQRLNMEGEGEGTILVLTDVNERRAARQAMATENERLELMVQERTAAALATDAELQEFCFSVSHDLRGPLRAVDGFTQSVLTDSMASLSDDNRDSLQRVRRAATRMGELIDGLLVLSRVARANMEVVPIDLTAMAERCATDLRRVNSQRDLQFDIAPGLTTHGDPALIATALDAIFGNAVKFTAERPDARIEMFQDGDGWVVRDNGVGFDMSYASKLFQPFEKLHPHAQFAGNGLGLALAARIIKRHGGTIEGNAEPGQGASIRFSIPSP